MILLTVVAIGLLTLSSISLRSSTAQGAEATARANARMAMMIAIGELQKQSGPDQRVTITSEMPLVGATTSPTHSNWTGVTDVSPSALTPNANNSTVKWLVSGQSPDPSVTLTKSRELNQGSALKLGTIMNSAAAATELLAPVVNITQGKNQGRYAWWIGDEGTTGGMKADISLVFDKSQISKKFGEVYCGATPTAMSWNGAPIYRFATTNPNKYYLSDAISKNGTVQTGPNWGILWNYATLWQSVASQQMQMIAGYPLVESDLRYKTWLPYTNHNQGDFRRDTQQANSPVTPVLSFFQMGFRLNSELMPPTTPLSATPVYKAQVGIQPVLGLWNPYNVTIRAAPYRFAWALYPYLRFNYAKPTGTGGFTDGRLTKLWLREEWTTGGSVIPTPTDADGGKWLLLETPAIDLQPGEFRLFSVVDRIRIQSGQTYALKPGWSEKGAFIVDLQDDAGNTRLVPSGYRAWFGDIVLQDTNDNYPTNTFAELEAKWPVADLEVRRLGHVVFPELVIPPRQDVGTKAVRIKSKAEYFTQTNLSFDGEQSAALEWNGALKRAAGQSGPWSLYYLNVYNAFAGGQAGGFAGVGSGTSVGILHHESGHALSLPHWGDSAAYPYKGDIYGIQAPSNYNETHAGPAWAFHLPTRAFIPPTVQAGNAGGKIAANGQQLVRDHDDGAAGRSRVWPNRRDDRISVHGNDRQSGCYRQRMADEPHIHGHPNLWGENGKRSLRPDNADGGYFYPIEYVNMVQRQQSWHLPDPVDPAPVERGITVYFTRLRVGGVDFAILEDRKFKSGPEGKIPKMGPRPDHINNPEYDPKSIDLPGLELLGPRQVKFLHEWGQDWTGAQMKAVFSQSAFCGAVHLHGSPNNRLLADLDCNGWPQTGRNRALEEIRRARAVHLCGDQHLAVMLKHGIDEWGDGPCAFTSPALVNTIYGRWWHPLDEKAGPNPIPNSPLPWTGDFKDGLGNRMSIMAYANPPDIKDERQRADGYGLVRFQKKTRKITVECWPRFADIKSGDRAQFPGWPITVAADENDGRKPLAWLPELVFEGVTHPVVQVIDEKSGEIPYTTRVNGARFQPPVYSAGTFTVQVGRNRPDGPRLTGLEGKDRGASGQRTLSIP